MNKEADQEDHTDNEDRLPYITTHLATCVVYAFYKCAGAKRMQEIWRQIQDKWRDMSLEDRERVQRAVDRFKREDGMYIV